MVLPPRQLRSSPSEAVQQLWREYEAWLIELPDPLRDDEERDETWARFMLERRQAKEKERLRRVEAQRSQKRSAVRKQQRTENRAQRQKEYEDALQARETWALSQQARLHRHEQRKAARGKPAGRPRKHEKPAEPPNQPRKRGRPVDPDSQRQRQLAMTPADRAREREERKAAQRAQPDKRFQAADLTLRVLTGRFVDVCYEQLLDVMRSYPDRVAARVEAAWRCALRVGEQTLRIELSRSQTDGRNWRAFRFALDLLESPPPCTGTELVLPAPRLPRGMIGAQAAQSETAPPRASNPFPARPAWLVATEKRARRDCLAQWESDAGIDQDHRPPVQRSVATPFMERSGAADEEGLLSDHGDSESESESVSSSGSDGSRGF